MPPILRHTLVSVRELLLMRSHHGLAPYQVLGRYPLEPQAGASIDTR